MKKISRLLGVTLVALCLLVFISGCVSEQTATPTSTSSVNSDSSENVDTKNDNKEKASAATKESKTDNKKSDDKVQTEKENKEDKAKTEKNSTKAESEKKTKENESKDIDSEKDNHSQQGNSASINSSVDKPSTDTNTKKPSDGANNKPQQKEKVWVEPVYEEVTVPAVTQEREVVECQCGARFSNADEWQGHRPDPCTGEHANRRFVTETVEIKPATTNKVLVKEGYWKEVD